MNPYDAIETCRGCLVWVCEGTLAVLAVALFVAVMLRTGRGLAAALRRRFSSPGASVAFALCLYAVWCGGTKRGGNPPGGGEPPPDRSGGGQTVTITAEDIARGWRLEGVATNGAVSYAMPSNGVEYARWSLRGGRETHFALDLGDFRFPAGTGVVRRIDVLSGGAVESLPRSSPPLFSVCAAREWASLVPGTGRFWWTDAEGGAAKLLTWENVYAGRDLTGQYSAQVELRGNGDFTARSNHVERVFRRVPPFDWDDDGLENSVDPDPLVAGPDAHGTNAEWYNNVCSNVFLAAETPGGGVALSPRAPDVNTNAYYFVDVVVSNGPAPVYFTADGPSRLGDPVIVARAGETNRVPLLIGATYAVSSDVPVTVSAPADAVLSSAAVPWGDGISISWPAESVFDPMPGAYVFSMIPEILSGRFSWTNGCCITARDNVLRFNCNGACDCGGCFAAGSFLYEGYALPLVVLGCGCPGASQQGGPGTNGWETGLSVGLSLERDVVLFEDAYTNAPGEAVAKQATFSEIALDFAAGENPAVVSLLVTQGAGKIALHEGSTNGPVVAGWITNLPARVSGSRVFYAEGMEPSGSMRDVCLRAEVRDAEESALANRYMTSGEIEVYAVDPFPTNHHRHVFGPFETVEVKRYPAGLPLQLNGILPFDGLNTLSNGCISIRVPSKACAFSLNVCVGDNSLGLPFRVIVPSSVLNVDCVRLPTTNEWLDVMELEPFVEGNIGAALHIDTSLSPKTVSFKNIIMMEGLANAVEVQGYFTNAVFRGLINHNIRAGAFRKAKVMDGNVIGTGDNLCIGFNPEYLPGSIENGSFKLCIPFYWFVESEIETNLLSFLWSYNAIYTNADMEVGKYGVGARRGTNDFTTFIP
ncbi:MAG: hypothetical protein IJR99_08165 [Kiritimatiellae bacterium]|nr:hypothetical protein [Kiritimatiellia bacterium]